MKAGVPDDCRIATLSDAVRLLLLVGRPEPLPMLDLGTGRLASLPAGAERAFGDGVLVEFRRACRTGVRLEVMLPGTALLTERGPVHAEDLGEGDVLLPDGSRVLSTCPLYVGARFVAVGTPAGKYCTIDGMYVNFGD